MAANLHLVVLAVLTVFAVFIIAVAYGQTATRRVTVRADRQPHA